MSKGSTTTRSAAAVLALLLGLVSLGAGCRREARPGGEQATAQPGATPQGGGGAAALDAEIERLEHQAERNLADTETRDELARAYVSRGDARRAAGQWREALADYQSALRHDPDNDEAQVNAAAAAQQLGGAQQEDENGAPVPPPITPNVSGEGEQRPTQTPTPKKQ